MKETMWAGCAHEETKEIVSASAMGNLKILNQSGE